MALTKETLFGALKTVNREYTRAIADKDTLMIKKWATERDRILRRINNYEKENLDG
jgi:hypothetical protein|tara:strand:+ start:1753 stop:1920 length:168 start_codon:yes stop_codon:yes gene_type:complete